MKRILVPCDFSSTAIEAFNFATDIAEYTGGEVVVLHVIDLTPIYLESLDSNPCKMQTMSLLTELRLEAKKTFEDLKDAVPIDTRVSLVIEYGKVCQTILSQIKAQNADLVIMGANQARSWKGILSGSVTTKIVRTSPVPVFTIHKASPVSRIKNIIFPTTMDLTQHMIADHIKTLQAFFKAEIHILYVKTPNNPSSDPELKRSLENYAAFYGFENFKVHVFHHSAEQDGIVRFSQTIPHSIVAMTTHGYRGVNHFVMGSITEKVVQAAHKPIWTFSSRQSS